MTAPTNENEPDTTAIADVDKELNQIISDICCDPTACTAKKLCEYCVKDKARITTLIATITEEARVKGRIEARHEEADAFNATLNLFRMKHPDAKLPRGLPHGFQKRMNADTDRLTNLNKEKP